jgi:hypothetical protein
VRVSRKCRGLAGAVDHPRVDQLFNVALLRRGEIVIEKDESAETGSRAGNLFELARPTSVAGSDGHDAAEIPLQYPPLR